MLPFLGQGAAMALEHAGLEPGFDMHLPLALERPDVVEHGLAIERRERLLVGRPLGEVEGASRSAALASCAAMSSGRNA
jgi:hypothetical protein